jgi:hypothetical protein
MRCNIQPFLDTKTGESSWRCTVHRCHMPCPYDGEPPKQGPPVHIDRHPTPEAALAYARRHTGGARPIVMHTDFATIRPHDTGDATECWCAPEVTQ